MLKLKVSIALRHW